MWREGVHEFEEVVVQGENFGIMAFLSDLLEMMDHSAYNFRKLVAQNNECHRCGVGKGINLNGLVRL